MNNFSHKNSLLYHARVIFIDDHILFRNGVIDQILRPLFISSDIIEIENGDNACDFIENEIKNKNKIDLIITDILHPGLTGNELVKHIRFYERQYNNKLRIPIIVLSMVPQTSYPELMADEIIDAYLSKGDKAEDIIMCLEGILKTN